MFFPILASYYRRSIKGFAHIAKPLSEKVSESVRLEWMEEMKKPLDTLKEVFSSRPVLVHPDYEKPFIVAIDASSKAMEAML